MSPTPSRSVGSSHSQERERFSPRSKGSVVSSVDDDVESIASVGRKVSGFRNNHNNVKASFSQKPNRMVIASPAPKRSFDMALRQMDHKRGPQNMFRPLLTSVPSTTLYAGKPTPAWNSSVTTSSNASSDLATSYAHEIEENDLNDDDATSEYAKVPDSTIVDDQAFTFEKTDSLNEDTQNETYEISPTVQFGDSKDGSENLADCDDETSLVLDDFREMDGVPEVKTLQDTLLCSRCGCRYSDIHTTEEESKLCENCQKYYLSLTTNNTFGISQAEVAMSDEDHESFNSIKPAVEVESANVIQFDQNEDLVKDNESTHEEPNFKVLSEPNLEEEEPTEVNHQVISQQSYRDSGSDQIQHAIDFQDLKVDSSVLRKSNTFKIPVIRSGNFSASSISYDDLSYIRESTNSMRSSTGRGSLSASSSFDFGPSTHTDTRFNRQLSNKKSEIENYKHKRSVSSFSGTSSHAFHPSSVGTSTLDSSEVSNVHTGKDLADVSSADPHENDTCDEIGPTSEVPTFGQTGGDLGEGLVSESLNCEEVGLFEKDEDVEKDDGEEDKSVDVVEDELSVISEGEVDQSSSCSSPVSQCNVSQNSESGKEEVQELTDFTDLTALHGKDVEALNMDGDTSNHASGIMEESLVVIEGEGTTKGRSLTLEEATDTILFCSSIVHNLAYEAATIAIDKQTPPDPHPEPSGNNTSFPLIPAIGKGKKDAQTKKPNKRSSKSQKTKKKKTSTKASNNTSTGEETDLVDTKPRIVFPNNKENRRPPELESKCNCSIM